MGFSACIEVSEQARYRVHKTPQPHRSGYRVVEGTSLIRKRNPPDVTLITLGIGLRWGVAGRAPSRRQPVFDHLQLRLCGPLTHSPTLTHPHTHTLTHSHTHTLAHSHTHTLTLSHSLILTHTHTLTHAHTHTGVAV